MARELRVNFTGDAKDLNRAADDADRSLDSVGKSGKGMMGGMAGLATGVGAAAAGLGMAAGLAMDFANAAMEDEQSAASLANVLKQTAGASDEQVEGAERWISAMSEATATADDELRPALQRLVGATGDTAKGEELLGAAMDIAQGTGKPLASVVEALTKAQMGNVGGLSKLGLATEDAAGNQLSLQQVLETSQKQFGGLAVAATDTASGGMKKAQIAMGEMKEQIGAALLPIMGALATFFTETLLPAIQTAIAWIQDNWPKVQEAIQPIMESVMAFISAAADVIMAIFRGPIGQVIIGTIRTTFETIKEIIEPALRIIKGIFDVFAGLFSGDWGRMWDGIKGIFTGVWDAIVGIFRGLWNTIGGIVRGLVDGIVGIFGGIGNALKGALSGVADLILAPFKAAFNLIVDIWNNTVGKLSFSIPDWVPGIGGKGFEVPDLPHWGGRMAVGAGVTVMMPVGTDPYATVAALNTYTARAGPLTAAASTATR